MKLVWSKFSSLVLVECSCGVRWIYTIVCEECGKVLNIDLCKRRDSANALLKV
jgi:hypothetical protein